MVERSVVWMLKATGVLERAQSQGQSYARSLVQRSCICEIERISSYHVHTECNVSVVHQSGHEARV